MKRAREEAGRVTIRSLFERWAKTDLVNRKDEGAEARRMMEKDVLPFIGEMEIKEIRKADIAEITDRLLQRGVNRMAKVVFSLIRQMFRFAVSRDLLDADSTALVSKKSIGGAKVERNRVLSEEEIRELAQKLHAGNMAETSVFAILNNRKWRIPPENSKNGREHVINLSDFSLLHFQRLHELTGNSEWCFPSSRGNGHICPKTVTKQVSDRQRMRGSYSKHSKETDFLILSRGTWKPHDLRRTGATLMELSWEPP